MDKPKWFTEGFKAGVPDEFIPKGNLDKLNKQSVGGKRRRSSLGVTLVEGARAATRIVKESSSDVMCS